VALGLFLFYGSFERVDLGMNDAGSLVFAGAFLEERDLAVYFGDAYRRFQRQVPMLIPKSFRPLL